MGIMEHTSKTLHFRTFSENEELVQKRRLEVARSASKVFTKKGYHQTNMRELAKACNLSTGILYHYFGSKEDILWMILSQATASQAELIETVCDSFAEMAPKEALRRFIKTLYEWHDTHQNISLFTYQETRNLPPTARQQIFESEGRILLACEKILNRGVSADEFKIENVKLMAHNIVLLGHAWAVRRWYLKKIITFDNYLAQETECILRAISVDYQQDDKPKIT